jgi:glycine hydroxymethyltransferase
MIAESGRWRALSFVAGQIETAPEWWWPAVRSRRDLVECRQRHRATSMPGPQHSSRSLAAPGYFSDTLVENDPEIADAVARERERQQSQIELIASENIVSRAVLEAQGSLLTNKYAEGYPGRRYYGGCEFVDIAESLAIERARRLFRCAFANVQPHSGAQANQAVMLALLRPGETILGMSLAAGGHLTHGAPPNLSGKWFEAATYGVAAADGRIDYEEVAQVAAARRPRLIIAGGSAYGRIIDFARFRAIADSVGAYLMVDMAHFAGLVAGGVYPSPLPHADVVTTTTHKTLRGPRGGMILADNEEIGRRINSAVFPGLQGGPLMHVIAAKAVALGEALRPDFARYARAVVDNAQALAATLVEGGLDIVSGGTDSHLLLVDLRPLGLTGRDAEQSLERAGITCNKNGIPFDPQKPTITSGIRLGTPAATTRGFGTEEFRTVGRWIVEVLQAQKRGPADNGATEARVRAEVRELCDRFPIYPGFGPESRGAR